MLKIKFNIKQNKYNMIIKINYFFCIKLLTDAKTLNLNAFNFINPVASD